MQLALATRGCAPAADPPPKSFTLLVLSRFWGSGAGKDEAKIIRCFRKSILDRFGNSLLRTGSKNIVKYSFVIVFVYGNYILQQGENCVNTSVFARPGAKNIKYCDFLPKAKNIVNTIVFGFRHAKIIGVCSVFCSKGFKNTRKHRLNDGSTKMRQ